ncbi:MAG: PD-(D/E)XK nuclease family protein [Campylobacterota bacterium]|nr:PD-(D/E)XK nuclease family protein [Campylobacterota bacterium]
MMQNQLTILPSSRSIRHRILSLKNNNAFLDPHITMSEFLNRLLQVQGSISLDSDRRNLLLLEASEFKNFDALKIERNFFTFIQNSHYIFRFLEELSGEQVSIEDIELADTYGDYEEHLGVLNELYKRYAVICKRERLIDSIFLKKEYTLNIDYLQRHDSVLLVLEGYLSNFEFEVLLQCADVVKLEIEYQTSRYNQKMTAKFNDLGFNLEEGYRYLLNLTQITIVEKEIFRAQETLTCKHFAERIEQIAFIKEQIYLMIQEGIHPDNIAVIVPDENFASQLRLFDNESNFNFAMGRSLSESTLYKKLQATIQVLDNSNIQNSARINRLGAEFFEFLRPLYHELYTQKNFNSFIANLIEAEQDKRILELIHKELYRFESLDSHLNALSMKQVLHIFLERLRSVSIDDVGGGKITVMGLLESRGVSFEGVVIVDFNESYVPRSSDKDLFLNSSIRQHSGLPTQYDREALQKHYYYLLISRAKKVAISYVESDDAIASRFLTQLGIRSDVFGNSDAYASLLFKKSEMKAVHIKEIIAPYDFTAHKLSATGLKSFLTCKRQFYYRYIAKINSHEIPQELPQEWEIGNLLHEMLKKVYEQKNTFDSIDELKTSVENTLESMHESNPLVRYQIKLWKKRLQDFYENEIERFKSGYRVQGCEEQLTCKHEGITLYGTIDRIDAHNNTLEVLDYKSGSYTTYTSRKLEEATDFQLEFYYLLASTLGKVNGCGFYDLKSGELIAEPLLEEKLELLSTHLNTLGDTKEFDFELCEDLSACKYCEYALMCGRR